MRSYGILDFDRSIGAEFSHFTQYAPLLFHVLLPFQKLVNLFALYFGIHVNLGLYAALFVFFGLKFDPFGDVLLEFFHLFLLSIFGLLS